MVLGFFMATGISTLMGTFFFQQFGAALANVQGDTTTGPFIWLGMIGVVMISLTLLIQTSFNLIYEVPDKVIAWFGSGMESRMAREMDGGIKSNVDSFARWSGKMADSSKTAASR
jgi:hypothetical protein